MNPAIQANNEGLDAILATSELKQNPCDEKSQRLTILVGLVWDEPHAKRAAFCDAGPIGILDLSSPSNLLARRGTHLFRRNN